MVRSLKKAIGALSVIALTVSLLPTVTAQTVPPTVQIVDNASVTGFTKTGTWYSVNDSASYGGKYFYALKGAPTTKAVWTFTNLTPGQYKVSVTYRPKSSFSKTAEFHVHDGGIGATDLGVTTVNQTVRASSGDIDGTPWQTLGAPGGHFAVLMNSLSVTLSAQTSASVQADAVRIERIGHLTGEEALRDFANGTSVQHTDGTGGGEGEAPVIAEIDALVLYTPDAVTSSGKTQSNFETMIRRSFECYTALDATCPKLSGVSMSVNGILYESEVPARVSIVGFQSTSIPNQQNLDDFVDAVATDNAVDLLRRNLQADIVIVVAGTIDNSVVAGTTISPKRNPYINLNTLLNSTNRKQYTSHVFNSEFSAFSAVRVQKEYSSLDMAILIVHEIGHILGSGHETEAGPSGLELWSHAMAIDGKFKTIDSANPRDGYTYGCPTQGCSLVPLFSNPNITLVNNGQSYAVGDQLRDNVYTMSRMAPIVASYSDRGPLMSLYNPEICHDTQLDYFVSPIDSLRIINYLNSGEQQEVRLMPNIRKVAFFSGFLDTNNDGWIAPIDSLRIINHLNSPTDPAFAPENVCPR